MHCLKKLVLDMELAETLLIWC